MYYDKTNAIHNEPCSANDKIDNGTALILTPYIKEGRVKAARNASRVDPDLFLGYESYSGYFTVNKKYNSNLFFWYFPMKKASNDSPWVIWLQGGPGASSMTGLFDEIGPFKVNSAGKLEANPYTWLQNHSLVFIDNPVGTGFSFTDNAKGYVKNMSTYSNHLFSVLKQFLQIFPELRTRPLYIAGESYAGKYVPALGMEIYNHRNTPGLDINLKGLIIGNAYVHPEMIARLSSSFYYFGLLEKEQLDSVKPLMDAFQQDIANNRSVEAKDKWVSLIQILLLLTHQKHAYNFLRDDLALGNYMQFLKKSEVKRAIHVGDIKFSFINVTVNIEMAPDFLSSTKHLFESLLDHYKVMAYCGQLDQMLPCVFTSENYRTWKWGGSNEFLNATRFPFMYNNKLAGYHKSGGRLTEVVVRGAGHMVPIDQPGAIQNLISRWTHDKPLSKWFDILQGSFIQDFVRNHTKVIFM